ncbi:MAG TPA: hypothetical protein VI566_09185 [Xanthomonadales bacterium]|nr:hypothetical protein [Xanthomonadales bacterium]
MMEARVPNNSQSLRNQVTGLERQLMLRHRRVQTLVVEINGKVAARLSSSGMLLAAVGIGVAVEQTSRHRGWSLATMLDAANACIGLLLSFSSLVRQESENAPRIDP